MNEKSFYFPIKKGEIIINEPNPSVEKFDRFDILFNTHAFVNIQIKLMTSSSTPGWLFKFPDYMLDTGNGPCINLQWVGYVHQGDKFVLSGPIDTSTDGYWYITIK